MACVSAYCVKTWQTKTQRGKSSGPQCDRGRGGMYRHRLQREGVIRTLQRLQ